MRRGGEGIGGEGEGGKGRGREMYKRLWGRWLVVSKGFFHSCFQRSTILAFAFLLKIMSKQVNMGGVPSGCRCPTQCHTHLQCFHTRQLLQQLLRQHPIVPLGLEGGGSGMPY